MGEGGGKVDRSKGTKKGMMWKGITGLARCGTRDPRYRGITGAIRRMVNAL